MACSKGVLVEAYRDDIDGQVSFYTWPFDDVKGTVGNGKPVPVHRKRTKPVLHLLLSIISGGLWLIV